MRRKHSQDTHRTNTDGRVHAQISAASKKSGLREIVSPSCTHQEVSASRNTMLRVRYELVSASR